MAAQAVFYKDEVLGLAYYQGAGNTMAPLLKEVKVLDQLVCSNEEYYKATQHVLPAARTPIGMTTAFVALTKVGTEADVEDFAARTFAKIHGGKINIGPLMKQKLAELAKVDPVTGADLPGKKKRKKETVATPPEGSEEAAAKRKAEA